ncbi:MAG: DUF4358 domain-containing protein [Clostridia bacterium]|nr:DUF4358 domain-containing protein [Clostridia bacterium]
MKKIWIVILIIVVIGVIVVFTNDNKGITIDINELSKDIIENIEFEDELNKTDNETASKLYDINNFTSQSVYMSSGATSEEIAIFEFEDKEACKVALEKANKRIEEQKQNFKDYMPKEMKKLENAMIKNKNQYLIVCITNHPEEVGRILSKYLR